MTKIYPVKAGEFPKCDSCSLFNFPKLCELLGSSRWQCESCQINGTYFYWAGWITHNIPENQILVLSDLYGKSIQDIRVVCLEKMRNVK